MSDSGTTPPENAAENGHRDVVAIGNALVDVLARTTDAEISRQGLIKGSMALIDRAQSKAVYEAMSATVEASGGSAANTVAGLAALGGRAGYIGKVADDPLGHVFLHDMAATGVEMGRTAPVAPSDTAGAERATGHCLILVSEDGERTMATHLGVAGTLGPQDLDEDLLSRAEIVYLEGYMWDQPPAKAALRRAIEVAHGADALVALTLSDSFCVERHRREFLDLLHGEVDVLFANEEEVTLLFGAATFDGAVAAVEETGLLAALTRGALGSVVVTASGPLSVAAEPVEHVVDTTGAGDLYAAGFLFGLTQGCEPERCARIGGLCAGEVISHFGARPQADLRAMLHERGWAERAELA